jgi:hypothetical protein
MLDKKYKAIYLDLISRKENGLKMEFSLSDNQTSDFYINITRNGFKIDLTNFKTTLYIKNPNGDVLKKELTKYDKNNNLYYCNLEDKYKNIEGKYSCQIIIEDKSTTEKVVPLNTFLYEVNKDIMSEGTTPDIPSGSIELEYNPDEEKIIITGKIDYDNNSEKIKEVI